MLILNKVKKNGNWLVHTYSDKNCYVKNLDTGKLYAEAYDPVSDTMPKYEETDMPLAMAYKE